MSNNRMADLLGLLSPAWALKYLHWQRDRERARQRLERLRTAEPAPQMLLEPEPPRDLNTTWLRMNPRAASQPWRQYAEELRAEQRALHHRIGRHHGITRAADNLSRWR
jgi:hypothetical protein